MSNLPVGTREPSAREWAYLKRTQQYAGVYAVKNEFGDTEDVWFDPSSEAPTA